MNCPESHDLLQERLDGRALPDRATLDAHLAGCPECRERHAAALRLADGLARLDAPVPPAGLRDRIVARVQADRRRVVSTRRFWTAAAIAAGLLLAALASFQAYHAGWFGSPSTGSPEAKRDRKKADTPAVVHRDEDRTIPRRAPSLGEKFDEARATALALTRRAAGQTVAQAWRWLPDVPLGSSLSVISGGEPLAPVLEPPANSLRKAGQGVTASLKPVTSSARRAFDLLMQQIPPMNSDL